MQNFTNVDENTSVKSSLYALIDNQKTVASDFSGTAFPTTNLILHQTCFRTDEQKLYRLTAMGPDVWTLETDLNAPQPVNAQNLPAQRPSLLMDFVNGPKRLQGKVTFGRTSIGTYYDSTGKLVTAAANRPRFDHDPLTKICRGLLMEEQRTNLLTFSSQLDNAAWTKTQVSVTADAGVAPDGTTTADSVVTTAGGDSYLDGASLIPASTAVVHSCFVKQGGASPAASVCMRPIIYADTTATNDDPLFFNFGTKAFSGATGNFLAYGYIDVGDGWYRIWAVKAAQPGQTSSHFRVRAGGFTAVANESVLVWGAQMEAGGFLTSYIPTTGAQATRSKDSAWINGAPFAAMHNPSEFSLVLSHAPIAVKQDSIDDWGGAQIRADGANIFALRVYSGNNINQADAVGSVAGAAQFDTWGVQPAAGQVVTQGFAVRANDLAYAFNGSAVETDSSVTLFAANSLELGANQWIRNVRYYPTRLSNAELQALTT